MDELVRILESSGLIDDVSIVRMFTFEGNLWALERDRDGGIFLFKVKVSNYTYIDSSMDDSATALQIIHHMAKAEKLKPEPPPNETWKGV